MLRVLVDENFDHRVLRAATDSIDHDQLVIHDAREIGLSEAPDSEVLERAAQMSCVVLTHDIRTLVPEANERVRSGKAMPGVVLVQWERRFDAVNDLRLVLECATSDDLDAQVIYLP